MADIDKRALQGKCAFRVFGPFTCEGTIDPAVDELLCAEHSMQVSARANANEELLRAGWRRRTRAQRIKQFGTRGSKS